MNVSRSKNANVLLLASLVDMEDTNDPDDSDYRFLVDGKYVKYVTIAPRTFSREMIDWGFELILLSELMPPFPVGDWNKGHVARDPETGEFTFIRTEIETFPGVKNLWHPVRLNEMDFAKVERLRQRVRISTHPKINDGKPVLVKIAVWPWEIASMEAETTAYSECIRDRDIGPKFLGHVTEGKDGRVVGFAVEWVQDTRVAEPGDLDSCRKALKRLHELGIKHGDTNRFNFLVGEGNEVVLIDFEAAKECSTEELEDEMNALKANLEDPGLRGGIVVYEC